MTNWQDDRDRNDARQMSEDLKLLHSTLLTISQRIKHSYDIQTQLDYSHRYISRLEAKSRHNGGKMGRCLDSILNAKNALIIFQNAYTNKLFQNNIQLKNSFNDSVLVRYNRMLDIIKPEFESLKLIWTFEHLNRVTIQ